AEGRVPRGSGTADSRRADNAAQGSADRAQDAGRAQAGNDADRESDGDENGEGGGASRRRRRRRQRSGAATSGGEVPADDPADTVVHVREPRPASESDDVRAVKGSTRLE